MTPKSLAVEVFQGYKDKMAAKEKLEPKERRENLGTKEPKEKWVLAHLHTYIGAVYSRGGFGVWTEEEYSTQSTDSSISYSKEMTRCCVDLEEAYVRCYTLHLLGGGGQMPFPPLKYSPANIYTHKPIYVCIHISNHHLHTNLSIIICNMWTSRSSRIETWELHHRHKHLHTNKCTYVHTHNVIVEIKELQETWYYIYSGTTNTQCIYKHNAFTCTNIIMYVYTHI